MFLQVNFYTSKKCLNRRSLKLMQIKQEISLKSDNTHRVKKAEPGWKFPINLILVTDIHQRASASPVDISQFIDWPQGGSMPMKICSFLNYIIISFITSFVQYFQTPSNAT